MVQKIHPRCNLGPKFSASCWSLVRKKNDLAVQYKDCPCINVNLIETSQPPHINVADWWFYSRHDPIKLKVCVKVVVRKEDTIQNLFHSTLYIY